MGNGRVKRNRKQKVSFAKDPKQAMIAIVTSLMFIIAVTHSIIKIHKDNNPTPPSGSAVQSVEEEGMMAENPNAEASVGGNNAGTMQQDANDIYSQATGGEPPSSSSMDTTTTGDASSVDIMPKHGGKKVGIVVNTAGRENPFMPPNDAKRGGAAGMYDYLSEPPKTLPAPLTTDAGKVMTTTISGILYDPYSPSAILNIEGNDYLVKRGDVVNHYKVLSITKTQVVVQLGKNVYKAGVGQLLSPTDLGLNTIANLNKKFGGNSSAVQISVKKRSVSAKKVVKHKTKKH